MAAPGGRNDASTASESLWVTWLLDVLLASGVNVHRLLEGILSTCCNEDDVM